MQCKDGAHLQSIYEILGMVLPMPELMACRLHHATRQCIQHPHLGRAKKQLNVADCRASACHAPQQSCTGCTEKALQVTQGVLHQPWHVRPTALMVRHFHKQACSKGLALAKVGTR